MRFKITDGWGTGYGRNVILLHKDNWDDFGYKTTFHASYCDTTGAEHELGTVKIGMALPPCDDQGNYDYSGRTSDYLDSEFNSLPQNFFSLWQSAEAYKLVLECENQMHFNILGALNDIAYNPDIYEMYKNEEAMSNSLFRSVSYSLYNRQYRRIARGEAVLTSYDFSYVIKNDNPFVSDCELKFSVTPDVLPPTNVHAIIGSNGIGKTTLIKHMIKSICKNENTYGTFRYSEIDDDYGNFENIVCVSFNPFDDYSEIEFFSKNFKYIGIKKEYEPYDESAYEDCFAELSLLEDIQCNFMDSLKNCIVDITKRVDLKDILEKLEEECNLSNNYDFKLDIDTLDPNDLHEVEILFSRLSAGHKVILSIITRCIDMIVEKSIVFIDEPENHLHPPLLSFLIRGISKMLIKRNGIAIISTHSPIVLQEIPSSSVWILNREGNVINARRPDIETFGTNLGVLTNEIFGYEVRRTGFNTLLQNVVDKCNDYDGVLNEFNYQLGEEAKSIVRIMLKQKEIQ